MVDMKIVRCLKVTSSFPLFGRSNKTLYDEVSLIPLPADYQPTLEQLPVTGTDTDKGKITRSILGEI